MQERVTVKLQPKVDHRFGGISHAVVDEDPVRRALISRLTRHVLESPNKQELMRDVSPEDGKCSAPMCNQAKKVVKNKAGRST